ncbi:DUF6443 domain-containing protein [Paraflavitalea speifideaquila]|uniref:DUF6443 domain-containing protein n=1 Tax=Paraflavitalea speifideaquila TaxID=3076558 RepID=UPI0028E6ED31|nr:DUF6443 domain-containing protein [Paraflavitalea speifideiaquila]
MRTYTSLKPIQDTTQLSLSALVNEVGIQTQYQDGYGRPIQSVTRQATPAKNDLVAAVHYDEWGRVSTQYLPFAAQSGNNKDGQFKRTPITRIPYSIRPFSPMKNTITASCFSTGRHLTA